MKIGYDLTSIARKTTGIEQYANNLGKNLIRYDKDNQYTLFFRDEIPHDYRDCGNNIECLLFKSKS